ncbi:MAG TPA: phosphate ABC transporter permease subunit PstC [Armatimonadota bacterium]|nr:phosphate ABC transporter permease subunit PstC [Armatimonadota bacterium]
MTVARREKAIERALLVSALSAVSMLALIAAFILIEGAPVMLRHGISSFLAGTRWAPTKGSFGILPMIVASVVVTLGAMVIAVPLGLSCAVFLAEIAPRRAANFLRPAIQLLAGIPSVVYGFVGILFLVPLIRENLGGPGLSVLAAVVILGVMVLPTLIGIAEDAIEAVPRTYKEGALALGCTHAQAIRRVILPAARGGIIAAVILAMGRAVGETMAVIMVIGNAAIIPCSVLDPARTLTSNIALEMGYAAGDHQKALFATGVVLFAFIMVLNSIATMRIVRGRR